MSGLIVQFPILPLQALLEAVTIPEEGRPEEIGARETVTGTTIEETVTVIGSGIVNGIAIGIAIETAGRTTGMTSESICIDLVDGRGAADNRFGALEAVVYAMTG